MDEEIKRQEQVAAEMAAAGVSPDEYTQIDYFGFEEVHRVALPDGKSWIEHKTLTEGARRKYMNSVNREVRLQRGGDAFMKMATGDERYALLSAAICGWNLVSKGRDGSVSPVAFTPSNLNKFLDSAPPAVVDVVERDVREKNPWIVGDVSVEDIDNQIKDLEELRERKLKEAEGKDI